MSKPSDLDKQPRPGLRLVVVERGGFEPPKAKPADLQSAPFDRFGTSPPGSRMARVTRTPCPRVRARAAPRPRAHGNLDRSRRCRRARLARSPRPRPSSEPPCPARAPPGAGDGTRTRNLLITNQLLYQLSYASRGKTKTRGI